MEPVELEPYECELKESISELLTKCKKWANENLLKKGVDDTNCLAWHDEMAEKAHELHMALKNRGIEVKHHKYMIENRGLRPDDPEFYQHIHAVEDLLAFLEDPAANDDPEDQTVGNEFEFRVFSRRWENEDTYRIKRTQNGWHVEHISINGDCDKTGNPFLFDNFEQDSIIYPHKLGFYLEELWNVAAEEGLTYDQVQEGLNQLAKWVSLTEKNTPGGYVR